MKNEASHTVPGEPPLISRNRYACDFRAIGYDLEAKGLEDFELEGEGINYLVVGKTKMAQPSQNGFVRGLRTLWENLQGRGSKPLDAEPKKVVYTPDSISGLRKDARQKRRQVEAMATTHSMSQVLRAVGAYLDLKEGRLLRVSKQGSWVTLQYEVEQGNRIVEEFTVSTLYDFCVRMYLKRRDRRKRS
jgi:hypothetical protein